MEFRSGVAVRLVVFRAAVVSGCAVSVFVSCSCLFDSFSKRTCPVRCVHLNREAGQTVVEIVGRRLRFIPGGCVLQVAASFHSWRRRIVAGRFGGLRDRQDVGVAC